MDGKRGMGAFIGRRNGPPAVDAARAAQFKENLPPTTLGNHDVVVQQTNAKTSQTLRGNIDDHDIFGTDASSAVDTTTELDMDQNAAHFRSTPPSLNVQGHPVQFQPVRVVNITSSDINEDDDGIDDDFEDENEAEHIDYHQDGQDKRAYRHENPMLYEQLLNLRKQELALLDADSYPATTSGRISETSEQDHRLPQAQAGHDDAPLDTKQIKQEHVANVHGQFPVTQQNIRHQPENQQPDWVQRERLQPAPAAPQIHNPHVRAVRQASPMPASVQKLPFYPPNPAPRQMANVTKVVDHEQMKPPKGPERGIRQTQAATSKTIQPVRAELPRKTVQHKSVPLQEHKAIKEDLPSTQQNDDPDKADDGVVELDYEEADLRKKDFAELQNDDYDVDPREKPTPQYMSKDELEVSISDLLKVDPGQQKAFFTSLTLSQWEEAGDVIMDRFSDLMAEVKQKRKEKRELSRQFEAMIAARHEEITAKRKVTDEALVAMKGAGTQVLETPKKMRRRA